MASEIRVNKIINRSGLSTVTFSDTGAIVSGIVTANSFSGNVTGAVTGSGANLTSIPAGQLTGTVADARLTSVTASKLSGALPALDGSALTGVGIGTDGSVNTSGIITATTLNYTGNQNLSRRNILINGAMTVAQRGTSSTTNGFGSVDRYYVGNSGVDEAPTHAQADISAGTTPYTLGFRKSLKITNGNQTSGAGAADYIFINMAQEAQNIANSGWNYKSSSSFITLSFWIKSSVAQNFFFQFDVRDGTRQNYAMETGSLTADTWTKITKVIPGNSNLTIDNNTGVGAYVTFGVFWGTDYTASMSLETWGAASDASKTPDNPTTWYTTNDATFEITGVQLEVGSVATPFEHRSYDEELSLCHRYYQKITGGGNCQGIVSSGGEAVRMGFPLLKPMRANPSVVVTGTLKCYDSSNTRNYNAVSSVFVNSNIAFDFDTNSGNATGGSQMTHGRACVLYSNSGTGGFECSAEL